MLCHLQLKSASADSSAWIAARFDDGRMPPQMKLGDSSFSGDGGFINRPLQNSDEYRVFVRAYTADDVSVLWCFLLVWNVAAQKNCQIIFVAKYPIHTCHTLKKLVEVTNVKFMHDLVETCSE